MNEESATQQRIKTIGLFVGPMVFVFLLVIPIPTSLSSLAMNTVAITAWMTIWWLTEAVPIPVTSLLPLALYPILGVSSMQEAASPYANQLIYLFLGGFIVALGIERVNLHKRIALHVVALMGSSPARLVLGFMCATAFLSMWISNTATTLMMLPIAFAVTKHLSTSNPDIDDDDARRIQRSLGLSLLLGVAYSASIGGIGTLIGTPPNIVFAGFVHSMFPEAPPIGFLQWMFFGVPVILLLLPIAWFLLVRVIPPEPLSRLPLQAFATGTLVADEIRSLGSMSKAERRMMFVFILTALAWIFRAPITIEAIRIPGLTDVFPRLTDATIAMAAGLSLFVIPSGMNKGERIVRWETIHKGVPWGVLLLFGGGFALADGLERTGVTLFLGSQLASLHGVDILFMLILVSGMLTFITEFTSNTATATILVPVFASAAVALGENPLLFMIPATINASFAFMLPVGTAPNAIVFSSGWITIRQMARAGFILNLCGIVVVVSLMYLLGMLVFDIDLHQLPSWVK